MHITDDLENSSNDSDHSGHSDEEQIKAVRLKHYLRKQF